MDDESDSSEDGEIKPPVEMIEGIKENAADDSSSSEDSLISECTKGVKRKRNDEDERPSNNLEDEALSIKFRRGEIVDNDLDVELSSQDSDDGSIEAPDEVDDGEWNMMGAALEREFLSNN